MTGKPGRKKREWNEYDKVLQSLYNIDLAQIDECSPIFGSGIKVLLCTSHSHDDLCIEKKGAFVYIKGKNEELLEPTFLNLAQHLGLLDWVEKNINSLVRKSNHKISEYDIHPDFIKAAKQMKAKDFQDKFVIPLRKELAKHGLYFYCIPSVSIEHDFESGEVLMIQGDEVLCVLPMSVAIAKKYNLSEEQIQALAPQVLYLVKNLVGSGTIKTQEQLQEAFDDWGRYVSLPMRNHIAGLISESRPDLAEGA